MVRERPAVDASNSTYPRVIIVTKKIPVGARAENKARKAFLWLLREETTHDLELILD